jgi:hypothetical protein
MEPLPISTMDIRVYDKEESPLHQIVKKLIWRKILDLEPYNFNYVFGEELKKLIYGSHFGHYDSNGRYSQEKVNKQKEIRETMTWDHPCLPALIDSIQGPGCSPYDPNPFDHVSRQTTRFIPLHSYQGRVFMEHAVKANGVKIVPDIALMDRNGDPETVIEIIYTGTPDSTKLINLVESDLNVIFVMAEQALEKLSTDMTCRRDYFNFPIREAWHGDTPIKEKLSRAVNILLQKKMHKPKEYIINKTIIKNTQWDPNHRWKKNRMNLGLKITTNERELDLSHSMIQMKETSPLIKLLRHIKKLEKQKKDPDEGMDIPVLGGAR